MKETSINLELMNTHVIPSKWTWSLSKASYFCHFFIIIWSKRVTAVEKVWILDFRNTLNTKIIQSIILALNIWGISKCLRLFAISDSKPSETLSILNGILIIKVSFGIMFPREFSEEYTSSSNVYSRFLSLTEVLLSEVVEEAAVRFDKYLLKST